MYSTASSANVAFSGDIIFDEVLFSEPGMSKESSPFWALSIYRMSQLTK